MGATPSPNVSIGRVALFNGPPSSGKTSIVNSLQYQISAPWFHLSLDDFLSGYSERSLDEDVGELFDRVLSGYLSSLRDMARAGNDVLAEAVITPHLRRLYESSFDTTPILLIGVKCRLEVAIRREANRTDRRRGPIELPPSEFAEVHEGLSYDLVIDTSDNDPTDLVIKMLLTFLELTPSSFASHLV
jgi:chloramphenicol 3-O phosphotransferase